MISLASMASMTSQEPSEEGFDVAAEVEGSSGSCEDDMFEKTAQLFSFTIRSLTFGDLEPKCPVDILVQHSKHMTCNRKLNARIKCM